MPTLRAELPRHLCFLFVLGLASFGQGCNGELAPVKTDASSLAGVPSTGGGGRADTGGAAGLSRGTGGEAPGTGGAAGSIGAGGNAGTAGTSQPAQPDAGLSDAATKQGGSSGTGGGSAASSGGASGGGTDGTADAGPGRDSGMPDLSPIPDAPVRLDTPAAFWTSSYNANCTPPAIGGRSENDGHHRAGEDCMRSGCHLNPKNAHHHAGTDCRGSGCHANGSPDGSGAPAFLFGGTVYRAVTLTADKGVEVAVKTTSASYAACSASNGNFWAVAPSGTTSLTWAGASARLRNANGEAAMMTAVAAGCNAATCHSGVMKMTSP